MKKVLAILLALGLVFSAALPAFAGNRNALTTTLPVQC